MYNKLKILFIVFATLFFSNCKKYDDGGSAINAKHYLYANGGVWFVDRYEVNGIDSTASVSAKLELNKNELKLVFKKPVTFGSESSTYSTVSTEDYVAQFAFANTKSSLRFYSQSVDCICMSQGTCKKFIFFPENKPGLWEIIKLTRNEITLYCKTNKNSYLIKLAKS
jgi:hypothetical protein